MNESTWLPGLVVLATGLFLGVLLAVRLRGRGTTTPKAKAPSEDGDLLLRIRDLEARRDDLYRRLRAADEDQASPEEIEALEQAAATTLRELDQLRGEVPEQRLETGADTPSSTEGTADEGAAAPEAAAATPSRTRNPLLVGFAFGALMVAVVALLVYWAVEDAQPGPRMAPGAEPTVASGQPPHEGSLQVAPEVAAQIADLQGRLVADPGDLMARKQLALTYVAAGQFFEAFNQASQVLQQVPDDPDGLLVHGIVRLTMGQASQAVELLDRVLAQYPDHRQALIYRGLALYQTGQVGAALDTWDMGLQMSGGSDQEFEELIQMARSGAMQPPGMGSATAAGEPNAAAVPATTPAPNDPEGFNATIELQPGAMVSPQATLFVFLRPDGGGPPVAARRIPAPSFPLRISLGAGDSMMGAELPNTGILVAKIDTDGNMATTDASDIGAEVQAAKGQSVSLTLGR